MIVRCLTILSLFYSATIFAQRQDVPVVFKTEIQALLRLHRHQGDFKKAYLSYNAGNWDSTLVYSMRQIKRSSHNVKIADYCHYFSAISFKNKKLLEQAKQELGKISPNVTFGHAIDLTSGQIALEQGHFEKALACFEKVNKRPTFSKDFDNDALYHNIGVCYFHMGKYNQAQKYLFKAAGLQESERDTTMLVTSYMDIANLYYEQFKDAKAIPYFKKAYLLSKKTGNYELKQNAALNMAVVEENRKDLKSALIYRKEFENWKDSLNDQNKVWAIADLLKKHAIAQKQKEITLLQAKGKIREAQRNGLFYSSALLLALFGTGIYFYRQKVRHNKIILAQKQALDKLNATKDQLFSIVSHDLRSSVNALKSSNQKLQQNLKSKNYDALDSQLHHNSKIANGTYNLLDNLLHWAMLQTKQSYFLQEKQHLFSVVEQVAYNYQPIMVEKEIGFQNRVATNTFVLADLDSLKIILRNLIDNAIKFSEAKGHILIDARASDDDFYNLVIEDSGAGMTPETLTALLRGGATPFKSAGHATGGTRLGMQLCQSLAKKIGGHLHIESTQNAGTKIILSIPKTKNHG